MTVYTDGFDSGTPGAQVDTAPGTIWDPALSGLAFSADGLGRAEVVTTNSGIQVSAFVWTDDVSGNMRTEARVWKRGATTIYLGLYMSASGIGHACRIDASGNVLISEMAPVTTNRTIAQPGATMVDGDLIAFEKVGNRFYALRNGQRVTAYTDLDIRPAGTGAMLRSNGGTGGGAQFDDARIQSNLPSAQTVGSITDEFDRATGTQINNGQGADWDSANNVLIHTDHGTVVRTTASSAVVAIASPELHTVDHEAWLDVPVLGNAASTAVAVFARMSGTPMAPSGYMVGAISTGGVNLQRVDSNTYNLLVATSPAGTLVAGGRLGIRVTGSTIIALVDNGSGPVEVARWVDTTYRTQRRVGLRLVGSATQAEVGRFVATDLGGGAPAVPRSAPVGLGLTSTAIGTVVANLVYLTARMLVDLSPRAASTKVTQSFARAGLGLTPKASAAHVLVRLARAVLGLRDSAYGSEVDITAGRLGVRVTPRATVSLVRSATARLELDLTPTARAHLLLPRVARATIDLAGSAAALRLASRTGRLLVNVGTSASWLVGRARRNITIEAVGAPELMRTVVADAPQGRQVDVLEPRS